MILFKALGDKNHFRVLSNKVLSKVLLRVLFDRVLFKVLLKAENHIL